MGTTGDGTSAVHGRAEAAAGDPMCVMALDGRITYRNDEWREFFRPGQGETSRADVLAAVHPDDQSSAVTMFERATENRGVTAVLRLRHHEGGFHRCNVTAQPVRGLDGRLKDWVVRLSDLDGRVRTVHPLGGGIDLRNQMLDAAQDGIVILDLEGSVVHANRTARDAWTIRTEDGESVPGQPWPAPVKGIDAGRARAAFARAVSGRPAQFKAASGDDLSRRWSCRMSPLRDEVGRVQGVLCVAHDVTQHEEDLRRLQSASETDALTEALNGQTFRRRLHRLAEQAEKDGESVGLLIADMDHFKPVNDTLGHAAGDHLLRTTARRLRTMLPPGGIVGRLGGDELGIAMVGPFDSMALADLGGRMAAAASRQISHGGRVLSPSATFGGALYPQDALDIDTLMTFADTALNHQKSLTRGEVSMFDAAMLALIGERAEQLDQARWIIREGALVVHYQPQERVSDGTLTGFEALMRWRDRDGAIQHAATVEHAFDDYALAAQLGALVRAQVFNDVAGWGAAGLLCLPVAINVSPVELLREDFAETLLAELVVSDVDPHLIEIEVTEQLLAERGADIARANLERLRDAGLSIALDDFGTGYSALSRLLDYPVDTVKIDRSFIAQAGSTQCRAVIGAIVALAQALDCRVVAEGVETAEQLELVRVSGCEIVQGYLIGGTVDRDAAAGLIAERTGAVWASADAGLSWPERAGRIRAGERDLVTREVDVSDSQYRDMFQALFRHTADSVVLCHTITGEYYEVSDNFCELTGYSRAELLGQTSAGLGLVDPAGVRARVIHDVQTGRDGLYENLLTRRDGSTRWLEFSHQVVGPDMTLVIIRDITATKDVEMLLRTLADQDPLTHTLNRRSFVERAATVLAEAPEALFAVIDLDGLKGINDTWGHAVGDEAIEKIAAILVDVAGEDAVVGRLGGDEFGVIVETDEEPADVLTRLRAAVSDVPLSSVDIRVSATVGAAEGSGSYATIARRADAAMYAEKRTRTDGTS